MTGVIIDPRTIYWIGVLGSVKAAMIILSICSGFAVIGFVVGLFYNAGFYDSEENKRYYKICKTATVVSVPMFIISTLAAVFIPTEKVMIEMMVTSLATHENIQMTADGIKEIVDYIVNAIATLK